MNEVTTRRASSDDWPEIAALLVAHDLPLDGAQEHLATYWVAVENTRIVGTIGIECHGDCGLLRSAAVGPQRQGSGIKQRLLAIANDDARARGLTRLYLLTVTAAPFFARHGFVVAARDEAPTALRASAEFRGACPASATLMVTAVG